jgi:hypothetical protein
MRRALDLRILHACQIPGSGDVLLREWDGLRNLAPARRVDDCARCREYRHLRLRVLLNVDVEGGTGLLDVEWKAGNHHIRRVLRLDTREAHIWVFTSNITEDALMKRDKLLNRRSH